MKTISFTIFLFALQVFCFSQDNSTKLHYIGEKFGGGIVFYLDGSGQHGLIASTKDYLGITWYRMSNIYKLMKAYNMTDGSENSKTIVAIGGEKSAAGLCAGLTIEGYSDWYLPSIKELSMMYSHFMEIGGFVMADYWSSTEDVDAGGMKAWAVRFGKSGKEFAANKDKKFAVRPIRKF